MLTCKYLPCGKLSLVLTVEGTIGSSVSFYQWREIKYVWIFNVWIIILCYKLN